MNSVVWGEVVCNVCVFMNLGVGKIIGERITQRVLKFKTLLTSFGSGGWDCFSNWK